MHFGFEEISCDLMRGGDNGLRIHRRFEQGSSSKEEIREDWF